MRRDGGGHGTKTHPAANDVGVDGARDAVLELQVELGDLVDVVDAGLLHVPLRGGLDHIPDLEALHGLVLRDAAAAVAAAHGVDVATPLAVLASVTTLLSHSEARGRAR